MCATHLEHDIRVRLAGYLAGETSLKELEDWLVPATWDAHHSLEDGADQLSSRILLHIAEHDDGWLSEETLKDMLRPLATTLSSTSHGSSNRP
ncbi:MAG: hypothetical protein M3439_07525 [Chloroflexota bacterium]|nr:hypothetical protein [Chloroflexota bacterium]